MRRRRTITASHASTLCINPVDVFGQERKPNLQDYPRIPWETLDLDQFNRIPTAQPQPRRYPSPTDSGRTPDATWHKTPGGRDSLLHGASRLAVYARRRTAMASSANPASVPPTVPGSGTLEGVTGVIDSATPPPLSPKA